jgi:glycosyltransferase involved in cell wall biosynthesis
MICLTMIVRNEAHVIRRSLLSALDLVDCVCICDTGSEDGTPETVCDLLQHSPKKVYVGHRAWVDFGSNRTDALRTAEEKFDLGPQDYHLILDADDVLDGGFENGLALDKDCYHLKVQDGSTVYHRAHLLRADGLWEYRSPVHEAPYRLGGREATVGKLDWLQIVPTNDKRPWTSSLARNMGARMAQGDWCFMVDGDFILPRKAIDFAERVGGPILQVTRIDREGTAALTELRRRNEVVTFDDIAYRAIALRLTQ